jgi:subtilase family serine protease
MKILSTLAAGAVLATSIIGTAAATPRQLGHMGRSRAADSLTAAGWAATKTLGVQLIPSVIDLGSVSPSMSMHVTLALAPKNAAGAQNYIKHEYTPGDPLFHQFLTPAQYTAAYGPSTAEVNATVSYLTSLGFSNITVAPNYTMVTASATAATVEQAFNTSLHQFNAAGKALFANVTPAMVPSALSGVVVSVLGLQNQQMTSTLRAPAVRLAPVQLRARQAGALHTAATPCEISYVINSCLVGAYYSDDFRVLYDDNGSQTASKTNIAIITVADTDDLISDLRQNEYVNGLRQVPVNVVNVEPPYELPGGVIGADQLEFSMDTQMSTGIAGDVKSLYLYNTGALTDQDIAIADNRWVSDDVAPVASQSLGECEYNAFTDGAMFAEDELFIESMAQGQTMFASSGDSGETCGFTLVTNGVENVGVPMVSYPASSTWVMGAGGTTPIANNDGTYGGEITWPWSGGGLSLFENPGWWTFGVQPGWIPDYDGTAGAGAPIPGLGGGNLRSVPDVAMDADANIAAAIFYELGAQEENGGTSLASPLSAGSYARLMSASNNTLGFAGTALYGHYKQSGGEWVGASIECYGAALDGPPATCIPSLPTLPSYAPTPPALTSVVGGFNDINYGTNGGYPALVGYDLTTGMGSFDLNAMQVSFGY